jgi:hypothetical protein
MKRCKARRHRAPALLASQSAPVRRPPGLAMSAPFRRRRTPRRSQPACSRRRFRAVPSSPPSPATSTRRSTQPRLAPRTPKNPIRPEDPGPCEGFEGRRESRAASPASERTSERRRRGGRRRRRGSCAFLLRDRVQFREDLSSLYANPYSSFSGVYIKSSLRITLRANCTRQSSAYSPVSWDSTPSAREQGDRGARKDGPNQKGKIDPRYAETAPRRGRANKGRSESSRRVARAGCLLLLSAPGRRPPRCTELRRWLA